MNNSVAYVLDRLWWSQGRRHHRYGDTGTHPEADAAVRLLHRRRG